MAKNKGEDPIVDVQGAYSRTEAYVESNKQTLTIIAIAIFVLFAGYSGFTRLYLFPLEEEASELIWKAEYYYEVDSLDLALHGDGNHFGFLEISDNYGMTEHGTLANYYIGMIYLEKGEYDLAIQYLEDGQVDDDIAGSIAIGAIGDAYVELGDYEQALAQFHKAANNSANQFTAPIYMKKAAIVYEELGNYGEALELYKEIKTKYPNSSEANTIDKYIARAEAYAG